MTELPISTSKYDDLMYVRATIQRARSFTKPFHDNIEQWRKLYDFQHYKTKPKANETHFEDPTYTNTTDLAVGILQGNEMIWQAQGWTPSAREAKGADRVEKFLAGVVAANSDANEYNIPYELYLHFVRDGAGALYTVWDSYAEPDSSEDFPDRDEGSRKRGVYEGCPIVTKVIDPLSLSLLPGGPNRWRAQVRSEQRYLVDIEQEYGVKITAYADRSPEQKAEIKDRFDDYWDVAYVRTGGKKRKVIRHAMLYAGEYVLPLEVVEKYDTLPYRISFYKPISRENSDGWHNIMRPMESSVQLLERNLNRVQRQVDMFSAQSLVSRTRDGRTITMDPGMGKIVPLGPDEDLFYPQWQGNPPDVARVMEFLRSRIQQSGFSDVMYGSGASSVSGYALSQLGDQNRIRLEQPVAHIEQLWTLWARDVLHLVDSFLDEDAIRLYGTMRQVSFVEDFTKDDVHGYHVECKITPEFPNERVRKHAMATQAKGVLSEHTIMQRYLDIQQPDDERQRKLVEIGQNHPVMQMYAAILALQELAESGDSAAALALEHVQAQMGTPGRPKEENNPEQLLGAQTPTGGMMPDSMGAVPQDEMGGMANAAPDLMGGIGM
jgi:hypothetical protein